MDFEFNEEQKSLQQMVRDFAQKEIEPVADRIDQKAEYPWEINKKLGQLGVLGLTIDEKYGGSGGDHIMWCIAMEEVARASASVSTVMDTSAGGGLCCQAIIQGSEAQKMKYLGPICRGEKIGCFGLTEANAGSDAAAGETVYKKDGNDFIINGVKIFISNAGEADTFVVFGTKDRTLGYKGMTAFILEKGMPGLSIGKSYDKLGIRGGHNAEIVMEDVRVPAESIIGVEGKGFGVALKSLDVCRVGVAAEAIGIARAALETAVAHMKQRVQYGQPISNFQGLQWKMVDVAEKIDAARLLTLRAADLAGKGKPFSTEAAMAKDYASEICMNATVECLQMTGGYGYMMDSPMQRYFRDAKITQIYEGTAEIMKVVVTRALFR